PTCVRGRRLTSSGSISSLGIGAPGSRASVGGSAAMARANGILLRGWTPRHRASCCCYGRRVTKLEQPAPGTARDRPMAVGELIRIATGALDRQVGTVWVE